MPRERHVGLLRRLRGLRAARRRRAEGLAGCVDHRQPDGVRIEALDDPADLVDRVAGVLRRRQRGAERGERPQAHLIPGQLPRRRQQLQLRHHSRGQIGEQRDVVPAPRAWLEVDRAQGPDRLGAGRAERHAGVGDHAEPFDGRVEGQHRVDACVLQHVGLLDAEGEGAEPGRERHPAHRRPRLRPAAAHEPLPVGADEVDQRHRHVEHAARHARYPVERLRRGLRVRAQVGQRPQPARPAHHLRRFRADSRVRHACQRSAPGDAGDPVEARNARAGQAVQGERLGRREVVDEGPAADGQVPDELVRREAEDERLAGSLDGADPRVGVGKLPGPLDELAVHVGEHQLAAGPGDVAGPADGGVDGRRREVAGHALPDRERPLPGLKAGRRDRGRQRLAVEVDGDEGHVRRQRPEPALEDLALDRLGVGVIDLEDAHAPQLRQPVGTAVIARAEDHHLFGAGRHRGAQRVVDVARPRDR